MSNQKWKAEATCASGEYDPDLWFPVHGDVQGPKDAKDICLRECPVVKECREYAVNFPAVLTGVWGGMTKREIRAERKLRGVQAISVSEYAGLPREAWKR